MPGGTDADFYTYTFTGLIKKHVHTHAVPNKSTLVESYKYIYDHAERLTKVIHRLNNGKEVALSEKEYDELSRLAHVKLNNGKNKVDYSYNLRTWPTGISSPHFTQTLHYTDGEGAHCYNGNISSTTWQTDDQRIRGYKFAYDGVNRLTEAVYAEGNKLSSATNRFNEQVLARILTETGYITLPDGLYHYFISDHQGNNRVVVSQDGTVEEVNHYYPFGGLFDHSATVQPYKYNGKELDSAKGLNWYDYGARMYDPALGRWHTADPLTKKHYGGSQYTYCRNNPIRIIDPDGRDGWDVIAGYGIGFVTDIIPGTGFLRDHYAPTDISDYNNALQGMDNASVLFGNQMIKTGGEGMAVGAAVATVGVVASAGSGGTLAVAGLPVAGIGGTLIEAGATATVAGAVMMANGKQNQDAGYNRGKKKNEITFTQGKDEAAKKITTEIPKGFERIGERSKSGMPVFRKGNVYISPDKDGHNGGIWKKGKSVSDLNNRKTRDGTYDKDLKRIGG